MGRKFFGEQHIEHIGDTVFETKEYEKENREENAE